MMEEYPGLVGREERGADSLPAVRDRILAHLPDKEGELFHHKPKGHDADAGPDPGQKGPFVGHVDPAVLNPVRWIFFRFVGHGMNPFPRRGLIEFL